jgi:hypothetical protein
MPDASRAFLYLGRFIKWSYQVYWPIQLNVFKVKSSTMSYCQVYGSQGIWLGLVYPCFSTV